MNQFVPLAGFEVEFKELPCHELIVDYHHASFFHSSFTPLGKSNHSRKRGVCSVVM